MRSITPGTVTTAVIFGFVLGIFAGFVLFAILTPCP